MSKKLTSRQREVYEYVRNFFRDHYRPPTFREIAAAFGFRSKNAATGFLNALHAKGLIRRGRRNSHTYSVVGIIHLVLEGDEADRVLEFLETIRSKPCK